MNDAYAVVADGRGLSPRVDLSVRVGDVLGALADEVCPVCGAGTAVHADCTIAAISWVQEGRFGTKPLPRIVRTLAPICYLCGAADTAHVEHVRPRAHGGLDSWDNVAGACQHCNLVKGDRLVTLTEEQSARLAAQQATFRVAYRQVTLDFAVESLARYALSPSPHKNPRIAQGRVLRVMCELLFAGRLVPIDHGTPWLEHALTMAQQCGWVAQVPDWPVEQAAAQYIERWREEAREREDDEFNDDVIDWRQRLDQLRRSGQDDDAFEILMKLIDESDAVVRSGGLPSAEWTQRSVIILLRRGDRDGEIALLRRYFAVCPPGHGSASLLNRLDKLTH